MGSEATPTADGQDVPSRTSTVEEMEYAGDLPVEVQAAHKYAVRVAPGLLNTIPALIRDEYPGARVTVLTDTVVDGLYGAKLVARLRNEDVQAASVVIPNGETSKSMATYVVVLAELLKSGLDRRGLLLNLGGGVINDLGGFVAATYMRGIAYVNVPTTMLAQVDSAIGGKVAVNVPEAKNFVGAFYHPRGVWSDPALLRTLPRRDMASGIAEAIKVAIIGSESLFGLLERHAHALVEDRDPKLLARVVAFASKLKIELLAPDPYEVDLRRVLNLGHTFAHPLEVELGYGRIQHGEAVAYGTALASAMSYRRGWCPAPVLRRILRLLSFYDLPPFVERSALRAACGRFAAIRLVRGNKLHYVLPTAVGACRIVPDVPDREILEALDFLDQHPDFRANTSVSASASLSTGT